MGDGLAVNPDEIEPLQEFDVRGRVVERLIISRVEVVLTATTKEVSGEKLACVVEEQVTPLNLDRLNADPAELECPRQVVQNDIEEPPDLADSIQIWVERLPPDVQHVGIRVVPQGERDRLAVQRDGDRVLRHP